MPSTSRARVSSANGICGPSSLATAPTSTLGSRIGRCDFSRHAHLIAAAARPDWVRAVVPPTGRPDLAGEFLLIARAPTLLVVGEYHAQLRARNEDAADRIAGPTRIAVLDGVGHVIDEPRAQEVLAEMCRDWFRAHLRPRVKARDR